MMPSPGTEIRFALFLSDSGGRPSPRGPGGQKDSEQKPPKENQIIPFIGNNSGLIPRLDTGDRRKPPLPTPRAENHPKPIPRTENDGVGCVGRWQTYAAIIFFYKRKQLKARRLLY